tara:strand:+ start:11866 stop:13515 length:1650 start_codon:yes stop_codon:yes gene_type:complete
MSEIQISKTLLILKSNPSSTSAAEQFLRNREWLVFSTTNIKDFLTYIIQKKPNFVMISVDHPNKKVLIMPKVLTQSFPICVFTFAENSSSVSFRKLQDAACGYKINPPATGPAIERTVNKYIRDQEKKIRDQNEKPTVDANGKPLATADASNKTTMIQSGGGAASGNETVEGGGWNQAASIFSQLLDGDSVAGGNGTWVPLEGFDENGNPLDPSLSKIDHARSGSGSPGMLSGINGDYSDEEGAAGSVSYSESDFDGDDRARALGKTPNAISIGKDKNDKKAQTNAGEAEDAREAGPLKSPRKYDTKGKTITVMGRNVVDGYESIILKGTKQALDETVQVNDGHVINEVSDSSQVACIVVESEKFNGYLIAALGKNRKMDGKFIKSIQEKLFKFLKDNGEPVSEKENLNLKIKKIEFEDWAIEYAEFLKKSVHNGDEIAMAFFPVTNVRTEVRESASATMASVKLADVEGDKQVEFNMYLYLPCNKKYILYTPKGGKFYANQKGRLVEKGVKEVHMLKSEVNDLTKYKAQNYLNNLIENYKQKKMAKAA